MRLAFVVVRPVPGPAPLLLARSRLGRFAWLVLPYGSRGCLTLVSSCGSFRLKFCLALAPLAGPLGGPLLLL